MFRWTASNFSFINCFCACCSILIQILSKPLFFEKSYDYILFQMFYNGTLFVQCFFIISGLLLAYNLKTASEKNDLNWQEVPKRIALRWLRLTPPYAITLALAATWMRHAGSGPLWEEIVGETVNACNLHWWKHLLFINNYFSNTQCMLQTWHIATDLQLHIMGLLVCILCKGRVRNIAISILYVVGFVVPGLHTIYQDLDGVLMITLVNLSTFLVKDNTFLYVYVPAHTNISNFILGIALGHFIYHLHCKNFSLNKYKIYKCMIYTSIPILFALILLGSVSYRNGPRLPIYVRVAFAVLLKPIFGVVFAILILGIVFKVEKHLSGFFEARIWTIINKISYCTYICHMAIIKLLLCSQQLIRSDFFQLVHFLLGTVCMSLLAATVLWLFVEAPVSGIIDSIRIGSTCKTQQEKPKTS
ncbi:unnamed protein product [Leptosia nina]|uniref:Acyltransferase 3 domain-containing protein n=1 Tax=Leptosia nina TaxID=320188 RepID=A0AAV1IXL6_9NEOP